MLGVELAMLIPLVAMRALNVADTILRQPAREQTLPSKIARGFFVQPVQFLGRFRFLFDLKNCRSLGLHPESQLERLNTSFELRILLAHLGMLSIDVLQHVELVALLL